jgi:hypothetical protein
MLQKGRSLHIGLNNVDQSAYEAQGWTIPVLAGCINDAKDMQLLSAQQGLITQILIDDQATSSEVIRLISSAASEMQSGDLFFLTFSGHGGQVDDVNGDEDDAKDETWVLWDRMLIDDELYRLFGQFNSGVRIFMLSDSCHSGTVARMIVSQAVGESYKQIAKVNSDLKRGAQVTAAAYRDLAETLTDPDSVRDVQAVVRTAEVTIRRFRGLPTHVSRQLYLKNKRAYDTYQYLAGRLRDAGLRAPLILISGCQDNQLSLDGDRNGLFTQTLLEVWNNGSFNGDYRELWKQVIAKMPQDQSPNFFTLGTATAFASERPLTVKTQAFDPSNAAPPRISVIGADSRSRNAGAPDFRVDTQGAPFYVTEFATDLTLFDYHGHGGERQTDNFYGSWSESPVFEASNGFFPMPNAAWNALKHADQIYYRVGTTTSRTNYLDYRVSTADIAEDGPCLLLVE